MTARSLGCTTLPRPPLPADIALYRGSLPFFPDPPAV